MSDTVLDRLVLALDGAASSDGNVFAPPVALFWPDKARQWKGAIESLGERRRVLKLGARRDGVRSGPAFWLRCVVAGTLEIDGPDSLPVIYLPGVSRDDLRSVAAEDQLLAPLVPLQHRSQWFTQSSGKDWTVREAPLLSSLLDTPNGWKVQLCTPYCQETSTFGALVCILSTMSYTPHYKER